MVRNMNLQFYHTFDSPFNSFTIIWKEIDTEIKIQRIFLSDPEINSEKKAINNFTEIKQGSSTKIDKLSYKIKKFLKGEEQEFNLNLIDLNVCFKSQKKVLLAEYEIPRSWVSTYRRIANKIGILNGARVVGNSLARNPFPIIIPCHRAIKSSGELGGYQGGIEMKRTLLEMEGIEFSSKGKVITNRVYY